MSTLVRLFVRPGVLFLGTCAAASALGFYWKAHSGGVAYYEFNEQLDGKVFIITGGNTGIGRATALELARRNARVILACKDMVRCHNAQASILTGSRNRDIVCRELDLASFESIRKFVAKTITSEPKVDVLINNAALMRCPHMVTQEGIEMQLGVNYLGHFLLTSLLLDKLKQAPASRIINITCSDYTQGDINFDDLNSEYDYDAEEAYNQSKLANVIFTQELARRLAGSQITVNAADPGPTDTELDRFYRQRNRLYNYVLRPIIWFKLKFPSHGAQTVLYTALSPKLAHVSGKLFANCKEEEIKTTDQVTAMRLWQTSEKWTRLSQQKQLLIGDIKEVQRKS